MAEQCDDEGMNQEVLILLHADVINPV